MMGGETVTVGYAKLVDDPYNPDPAGPMVEDWSDPTTFDVAGVLVEPRPSSEPAQDARNAVVSGFTLYLPSVTADVSAKARVLVRGAWYKVQGESADWRLGGWRPGKVVQVERVEG